MSDVEKSALQAPSTSQRQPKSSLSGQGHPEEEDAAAAECDLKATDASAYSPWNDGVEPMPLYKEVPMVVVIICVQLFTQAALGAVLAPLHIIGDGIGVTDPGELSWLIAGYSLTVGIFVLPSGRLGDIYGHKKMFMIGIAIFALFSLLLGFSVYVGGPVYFAIFRAFQGIGPAILNPNGVAIFGRVYKPGLRKRIAFAAFAACGPNGWLVGAVFASLLSQLAWWPWSLWIMAIAVCVLGAVAYLVIPPDRDDRDPNLKFDHWGALTGVSGMVLFNFAWNQAPVVGWDTPYVYALLIVSVLILTLFAWVETKVEAPLIPTSVYQPLFVCMLISLACGWASFGTWNYYLVTFVEELKGATPLLASAYVAPAGVSGIIAGFTVGFTLPVVGPIRTMALATTAFMLANILLSTAGVDQMYWKNLFVSAAIAPFGMDMSLPAALVSASDAVPVTEQGTAASLVNTVVNYSISIGLGVAATAERYRREAGDSQLEQMRAAEYVGVGFGVAGFCVAVSAAAWYHVIKPRKHRQHA